MIATVRIKPVVAIAFAAVLLAAINAGAAPRTPLARDASAVLKRASETMGASALDSLRYAAEGAGWTYGQSFTPGTAWPKIIVHAQQRTINYASASLRDEITLSRAEPKGGGGYPPSGS